MSSINPFYIGGADNVIGQVNESILVMGLIAMLKGWEGGRTKGMFMLHPTYGFFELGQAINTDFNAKFQKEPPLKTENMN